MLFRLSPSKAIAGRQNGTLGRTGIPWLDVLSFLADAARANQEAQENARIQVEQQRQAQEEAARQAALAEAEARQKQQQAILDFRNTGPVKLDPTLDGIFGRTDTLH